MWNVSTAACRAAAPAADPWPGVWHAAQRRAVDKHTNKEGRPDNVAAFSLPVRTVFQAVPEMIQPPPAFRPVQESLSLVRRSPGGKGAVRAWGRPIQSRHCSAQIPDQAGCVFHPLVYHFEVVN